MKNYYLNFLTSCALMLITVFSYGQFSMSTNTTIGQKLTVDTLKATSTFIVDFNTIKPLSTWTYDETTKVTTVTLSKCQTQRGFQVNVYPDATSASAVINGDFECRDYGGNRNPVHVKSVASLTEILEKMAAKAAGTADSVKNVTWKPSACIFDLNADGTDQGFGATPGMYKRIEYGFQYNFAGVSVTSSDISFDINTYDPGNTGKTASYTLTVATGSASNVIATVSNFYITGSGKKSIKLAQAIGKTADVFANQKVYFFLKTQGTETAIAKGTYDPTIVIDNLAVSFLMPSWVTPPAGIVKNLILDNALSPVSGIADIPSLYGLSLKTSGRLGALTIINDREFENTKLFTFLETGAIKAKDSQGKYTIDVPYTFTPGSTTVKEKIVVSAPVGGKVDDDLMFYLNATTKSLSPVANRLELDCGTRIWYNFNIKSYAPDLDTIYSSIGKIAPVYNDSRTIYQLNLPAGTKKVSIMGSSKYPGASVFHAADHDVYPGDQTLQIDLYSMRSSLMNTYKVNVHVANSNEILFVGGDNDGVLTTAIEQDQKTVEYLKKAGYSVTFLYKWGITPSFIGGNFDFSPYKAVVFGASAPSDGTKYYAQADYPIPCVNLQKDGARYNKWGWTANNAKQYTEIKITNFTDSIAKLNALKMTVTDNNHYITQGFKLNEEIMWTDTKSSSTDFSKIVLPCYYMGDSLKGAIALAKQTGGTNGMFNLYAIPRGTQVNSLKTDNSYKRTFTKSRIVLFSLNSDAMRYPNANFGKLLLRSLEWVLGSGGTTSVSSLNAGNQIKVYPNPADGNVTIKIQNEGTQNSRFSVLNLTGQKVFEIGDDKIETGVNEFVVNTASFKQGLYIWQFEAGNTKQTGKLQIIH